MVTTSAYWPTFLSTLKATQRTTNMNQCTEADFRRAIRSLNGQIHTISSGPPVGDLQWTYYKDKAGITLARITRNIKSGAVVYEAVRS